MVKINPIRIRGNWKEGFAMDLHTLKSDFIGYDEYGTPQFDTTYTEMGKLLHRLKYDKDNSVLDVIITTASQFIRAKQWPVDLVISVPPSKKDRTFQLVLLVAKGIAAALGLNFLSNCIVSVKQIPELKGVVEFKERLSILNNAYDLQETLIVTGHKVLLFDDLYRSGATLNVISGLLKEKGGVNEVYAFTLTKTRSKR